MRDRTAVVIIGGSFWGPQRLSVVPYAAQRSPGAIMEQHASEELGSLGVLRLSA